MDTSFATDNKLGLPLASPSRQTILPVICGGNGNIRGWIAIAATTFNGTETSFTTADGPIAITTVTLPNTINDGQHQRVRQYMAAVFDNKVERLKPWLGYSAFLGVDDSQYSMRWYMPTVGQGYNLNLGPLIKDLTIRMDVDTYVPPNFPAPNVTNGAMTWAAALTVNDLQMECSFFDLNWVNLFKAQSKREVLRIEVVSNPASGEFKTSIVPYQSVQPQGGVEFNTLRIIKLRPVAAGAYVFTYKVIDDLNQATTVTLTLTIT